MPAHSYMSAILPSQGLSIPGPLITQGQAFFVNPYYGSGSGKTPNRGMTSLSTVLSKMTANKNDVAYMLSAHDTGTYTTDYLSATLDWNKDMAHLIGVGAGQMFSPRSRVAFAAAYNTASNLFTVSANDCMFHGINFFEGVAGALPTGCLRVTGNRNVFRNCHIAGIGNDANDIAGAYSLYLSGSENLFERCVIGLDTIDRGSFANSEIYLDAGCGKTVFRDCYIVSRLQHSTNSPNVRVAGGSLGNPSGVIFDNCIFINTSTNYGFDQTYVFAFTAALTAGRIFVRNCSADATNWGVAGNKLFLHNSVSNTGYNQGLAYSS